jgi:hypothetical protein
VLFPNKVDIDADNVVYYKGAIIGHKTSAVPRKSIASVQVRKGLLIADIAIESAGGGAIVKRRFPRSDNN